MAKRYILISLITREKLIGLGKGILSLFYEKYPLLAPQYASYVEPINKPIPTIKDALEYWDINRVYYRRKNSTQGWWSIGESDVSLSRLKFEYNWNQDIDWFILFQQLVELSKAYFGYVHVFTDNEIEPAGMGSAISLFLHGTASFHLKKGIPQLGWGNYFGEEYVKEIDVNLLKKHGFEIQPLGEGYVFNITPQISDVITDYETFDNRRTLLKSLFRPDLFRKYSPYAEDDDENPLMKHIRKLEAERNKTS